MRRYINKKVKEKNAVKVFTKLVNKYFIEDENEYNDIWTDYIVMLELLKDLTTKGKLEYTLFLDTKYNTKVLEIWLNKDRFICEMFNFTNHLPICIQKIYDVLDEMDEEELNNWYCCGCCEVR
jgi:hypothetical protein